MIILKYNPATERFDCYCKGEFIQTLTCGTRFNLYFDDEDRLLGGGELNITKQIVITSYVKNDM